MFCALEWYAGRDWSIMKILSYNRIKTFGIKIIDSSSKILAIVKKELPVTAIMLDIDGKIDIIDDRYDVNTRFDVLHHIQNLSFVVSELIMLLRKNGSIVLREAVSSVGEWGEKRIETAVNGVGLGVGYLKNIISEKEGVKFSFILMRQIMNTQIEEIIVPNKELS